MKLLSLLLDLLAVLCIGYVLYLFYRMKRMLQSTAWAIINCALCVLVVKWIYDAMLLYKYTNVDIDTVLHEVLTFLFALLMAIGFDKFYDDFSVAKNWNHKSDRK